MMILLALAASIQAHCYDPKSSGSVYSKEPHFHCVYNRPEWNKACLGVRAVSADGKRPSIPLCRTNRCPADTDRWDYTAKPDGDGLCRRTPKAVFIY